MPSEQSTLQSQYPLSPRKFWKKMIEKTLLWVVLLILLATVLAVGSVLVFPGGSGGVLLSTAFVVAFLALILVMVLYGIYVRAYIRRYYYDATDSYITIRKGVFAPAEIHVQYSKIQDVYVDQDILDRVMGLYDVHLATATVASGLEAHIDGVEQVAADGLKNFLLQKLQTGGVAVPSPTGSVPGMPSNLPTESVTFEKEISSTTYPITDAWFGQQAIAWFFSSAFVSAVIVLYVFAPGKNGGASLASLLNLGTGAFSGTFWGSGIIIFMIVYAAHLLYAVFWRSNYSFSFLPDYIVTKQGIIAKTENHLPYRSVQDVSISQSIIERLLGIATVRIENAAAAQAAGKRMVSSAVRIPGQPLAQANEISDAIKRVALARNSSQTGL